MAQRSSTRRAIGPICHSVSIHPPAGGTWPVRASRPDVGLMAGDAAEMRRKPDAAGRVAAQSEGRSARRDQRRLAAARSAGGPRAVVRIIGAPVKSSCRSRTQTADPADWSARSESPQPRAVEPPVWRRAWSRGALRNPSVPAVQPVPATSMESLIENGTPSSGPSERPVRPAAHPPLARPSRAGSASTSTTAFSRGFTSAMRSGAPPPVPPKRSRPRESTGPVRFRSNVKTSFMVP